MYRKPTTTDVTMHTETCHPYTHKMALYNSSIHRLLITPLDQNYKDELINIKYIARASRYKMVKKLFETQRIKRGNPCSNKGNTFVSAETPTSRYRTQNIEKCTNHHCNVSD